MNIIVCIKQVPDVTDIKWTKENNLDRSSMLTKINLYDEWALNHALTIKEKLGINVNITAISMGPSQAKDVLNYALAKGANRAILLSDKRFSGSDTLATSKIIAQAIRKYVDDFNLIITGQMAQDGDTAQVPVSLAECLNIPDATSVVNIASADKKEVIVLQEFDEKSNLLELASPCVLAVKKDASCNRVPKINDYIYAQNKQIEEYNMQDLGLSVDDVGIIGSPTVVYKAFRPIIDKKTEEINDNKDGFVLNSILEAGQK